MIASLNRSEESQRPTSPMKRINSIIVSLTMQKIFDSCPSITRGTALLTIIKTNRRVLYHTKWASVTAKTVSKNNSSTKSGIGGKSISITQSRVFPMTKEAFDTHSRSLWRILRTRHRPKKRPGMLFATFPLSKRRIRTQICVFFRKIKYMDI